MILVKKHTFLNSCLNLKRSQHCPDSLKIIHTHMDTTARLDTVDWREQY